MQILSIGNSFSQDAQRYLHGIARSDGTALQCCNLYIGGCSLERHYRNMLCDARAYTLEINGHSTGFPMALGEALCNRQWDVVTLQQVSHLSVQAATYQPYLGALAEYVRRHQPHARLLLHQTWAYEAGSARLQQELGYATRADMFAHLQQAYAQAALQIAADGIIPAGALMEELARADFADLHRDTFHAGWGAGRYALGLLWYAYLTGRDVQGNAFADFDAPVCPEQVALAKACVARVLAGEKA